MYLQEMIRSFAPNRPLITSTISTKSYTRAFL